MALLPPHQCRRLRSVVHSGLAERTGQRGRRSVRAVRSIGMPEEDTSKRFVRYGAATVAILATCFLGSVSQVSAQALPHDRLPTEIGALTYQYVIGDTEAFGEITDVAVSDDGVTAVLDAFYSRIAVYNASGALIARFGRKGSGPGEFFAPVSLDWKEERLLVLDRGNARISTLRVDSDSIVLESEFPLRLSMGRDLCVAGNRVYVLSFFDGSLVHEVGPEGERLGSFGVVVPDDILVGDLSSVGSLGCSDAGVAMVSEILGYVQVFSPDGRNVWNGAIDDFEQQQYSTNGGGFRPLPARAGYVHRVVALNWLDDDRLVVQLMRSNDQAAHLLESRTLDIHEGWLENERAVWPRLGDAVNGLYAFEEVAPFPVLKIYR